MHTDTHAHDGQPAVSCGTVGAKQEESRESSLSGGILQSPQPPCQEDSYGVMQCHLPILLGIAGTSLMEKHLPACSALSLVQPASWGLQGLEVHFHGSIRADHALCTEERCLSRRVGGRRKQVY